ncbi:MAG: hypothetical protein IPJ23_16570 [Ignavibacteriales bacterium]|nr:hypothetical protein [Ignavibacteriales bacterium]
MDEGNKETADAIKKVLDQETISKGLEYHQLRYRESGNVLWLEFHLLFPKGTLLEDAHNIATALETTIKKSLSAQTNITTHLEPIDMHDEIHSEPHN